MRGRGGNVRRRWTQRRGGVLARPGLGFIPSFLLFAVMQVMNCEMMGGRPMVGCPQCGSMEDCAQQEDPFLLYGQHCLDMRMIGCQGWSAFYNTDAAGPDGTSGIAFAAQCIRPTVAVPPTPPPAPITRSPCFRNPLSHNWCKNFRCVFRRQHVGLGDNALLPPI